MREGVVGLALIRGWALINFSAFKMGAYSRWALIRGWALIRINTVVLHFLFFAPTTVNEAQYVGTSSLVIFLF